MSQGLKAVPGGFFRWQRLHPFGTKPLQHMPHVGLIQHGIGQRGGAGKGLIAPGREFTHQSAVRAGAKKQEMARGFWSGIDRIPCGLEGQQHLVALLGGDRLLHLIDDQHHIAAALIHDFRERLGERDATGFTKLVQLEPEAKAHPAQIQTLDPAQPGEQR